MEALPSHLNFDAYAAELGPDYPNPTHLYPVPADSYVATVAQVVRDQSNRGDFLRVDFRIVEGPQLGRVLAKERFFCTQMDGTRVKFVSQLLKALHVDHLDVAGDAAEQLVQRAAISGVRVQIAIDWESYDDDREPRSSTNWQAKDAAIVRGEAKFKHRDATGSCYALGVAGRRLAPSAVVTWVEGVTDTTPSGEVAAADRLRALGVRSYQDIKTTPKSPRQPWVVQNLIRRKSVNGLIGDSGLGKTPLLRQMLMCVAAGVPFLGMPTEQGRVLYCDSETPDDDIEPMMEAIARHLGLSEPPPDFREWDVHAGDEPVPANLGHAVLERVRVWKPSLVVVDPLRTFWPNVEKNQKTEAVDMVRAMRELSSELETAWVIMHHRRKMNRDNPYSVSLRDDPKAWLQDSAGTLAFINHIDSRLGIEEGDKRTGTDLVLGGFVRGRGDIPVVDIGRVYDDNAEPLGYRALTGLDHLSVTFKSAYQNLPQSFRFTDAKNALGGNSDSNTNAFLVMCQRLQLLKKEDRTYSKLE